MAINVTNGWTAKTISHDTDLHDQSLATRTPDPGLPAPADSSVGLLNAYGQSPLSAAQLLTDPSQLHDPSLGARAYMNPGTGLRDAPIVASAYEQNNVPAFLQQSIANLNAEQTMKRAQQSELVNRIVNGVQNGGANSYLWTEALRGAAVNPGAHVTFGSAVQNPLIGQGYNTAANAYAARTAQQTNAIQAANSALGPSFADLLSQRAHLGTGIGIMGGTPGRQQLDQQITNAYLNATPNSAVQQLGRASASGTSGWFPQMPTY